jgi:nicotinate-nucleotide pyrophosphorylase (carboxylating)
VTLDPDLRRFLEEDVGSGDITAAALIPDGDGRAVIISEDDATVAGLEEAAEIFSMLGVGSVLLAADGDRVSPGQAVMEVEGPLAGIVTAERTALNIIMRMSGIATMTRTAMDILEGSGTRIAGTRKTTPGFRRFEKKAIVLGGGYRHRMGLYDEMMIKDNHAAVCGSVEHAMKKGRAACPGILIDCEVSSVEDAVIAAENGADIVMADNMGPEGTMSVYMAVKAVDAGIMVEASGDVNMDNLKDYAGKADIVSMGALTHSVKASRFSLDIV